MKEREPEDDPLEPRRGRRRVWPTLGLALGMLVLIYLGGWLISGARFSGAIGRLRAQGEPVRPSDLAPKLKPGEPNAADIYEQASALAPRQTLQQYRNTSYGRTPSQRLALARTIVASSPQYFALLEEASRLDTCAFPGDWDSVWRGSADTEGQLFEAASALEAKAAVEADRGDLDGALASGETILRIARHLSQGPSFVAAFRVSYMQRTALHGAEAALSRGDPSPKACHSLASLLAARDHRALLTRALRLDRAYTLQIIHWMETGGWLMQERPRSVRGVVRETYPMVAKPLWNADKEEYLAMMAALIEAAQKPWPEAGKEALRLDAEAARRAKRRSSLVPSADMVAPPSAGSFGDAGQNAALSGAWQIALALKAYHHDHHTYPASLAELEKATWKLPRDPFTQRPYRYRRKGAGFKVWSVGFDGKDNGGLPFTGHREEALRPGTDFVVELPH